MGVLHTVVKHFDLTKAGGDRADDRARPGTPRGELPGAVEAMAPAPETLAADTATLSAHSDGPHPRSGSQAAPPLTPGTALLHYVCLVLGVLAKFFIEFTHGDGAFNWLTLLSSLIISAVVYPFIFRKTVDQTQNGLLRYFVCFQNGFFFQSLLEEIQSTIV